MSRQNRQAKKAQDTARAAEAKRLKTVRIVLAVLLAAAVIAGAAVGIRALVKRGKPDTSATKPAANTGTVVDLETADNTYVDYKGMQMPAVYADLMEKGDALRKSLCEEGVVMKIGDREISKTEFEMYYYDQYRKAKKTAESTLETYGENRSGFDPNKLPSAQVRQGTTTWEAYFIDQATEQLRHEAAGYACALAAGTKMNSTGETYLQERISASQLQAELDKKTEDELFRDSFGGANVTATLYYTRLIMNAMTSAYQADWSAAFVDRLTQDELQAAYDADPRSYQAIDARIYMLEDASAADAAAQVRTEEELIAFAEKYHPTKGMDMDVFTDFRATRYSIVNRTYGETVANWLFDDSREIGVCELVDDGMFRYLVLPLSKPYLSTSVDVELVEIDFMRENEDSIAEAREAAEAFRDKVVAGGGTAEAFEAAATEQGEAEPRCTFSITDFDEYGPASYLFSSERKPGDLTVLQQGDYFLVILFLQKNAEDYDWIDEAKSKLVNDGFEASEAEFLKKNAGKINQKTVEKAAAAVNDRLAEELKNS